MQNKAALKTKSFKVGFTIRNLEEFQKDFAAFLKIPAEVIDRINQTFKSREDLLKDNSITIGKISEETGYSGAKIGTSLSIISFFAKLLEKEESIDDLLSDFCYEGYLKKEDFDKALDLFIKFKDIQNLYRKSRAEKYIEQAGAAIFDHLSFSSNVRLKPKKKFATEDKIDSYIPQLEMLIPMGNVEICIEDCSRKTSFSFQVTLRKIREIIKEFQALEKELVLLEKLSNEMKK